jgi:hypothetical protein
MFSRGPAKKTKPEINEAAALAVFDNYCDPEDTESMNMDGIGAFCEA